MKSKRAVSVLAIVGAMGMALVATPSLAHPGRSTAHAYKTAPPTRKPVKAVATVKPHAPVKTGAGGTYPVAGPKPVLASAPSYGTGAKSNSGRISSLPATGGAAR